MPKTPLVRQVADAGALPATVGESGSVALNVMTEGVTVRVNAARGAGACTMGTARDWGPGRTVCPDAEANNTTMGSHPLMGV